VDAARLADGRRQTEDGNLTSVFRLSSSVVIVLLVLDCFVYLFPRTPFIVYNNPSLADIARFEVESQALGTTSASEYLPLWTQRRMYDSPLVAALLDNRTPDHLQREALPVSVHIETLAQSATRDLGGVDAGIHETDAIEAELEIA